MTLSDDLLDLRAAAVLVLAAERGLITELACAMPECRCPQGRTHFDRRGGRKFWAPSADRFPVPGRDGGTYVPGNVRLAHWLCNSAEGGRAAGLTSAAAHARTDEGRQQRRRGAKAANAAGAHMKGAQASLSWSPSPEQAQHRATTARAQSSRGLCQRWQINRGSPCTCGTHGRRATSNLPPKSASGRA